MSSGSRMQRRREFDRSRPMPSRIQKFEAEAEGFTAARLWARRSLAVLGPWSSVDSVQQAGLCPLRVEPVGYPLGGRQPFFFASLRRRAGGSGGIRTPGRLPYGGFQNRCLRPLGHSSKSLSLLRSSPF